MRDGDCEWLIKLLWVIIMITNEEHSHTFTRVLQTATRGRSTHTKYPWQISCDITVSFQALRLTNMLWRQAVLARGLVRVMKDLLWQCGGIVGIAIERNYSINNHLELDSNMVPHTWYILLTNNGLAHLNNLYLYGTVNLNILHELFFYCIIYTSSILCYHYFAWKANTRNRVVQYIGLWQYTFILYRCPFKDKTNNICDNNFTNY